MSNPSLVPPYSAAVNDVFANMAKMIVSVLTRKLRPLVDNPELQKKMLPYFFIPYKPENYAVPVGQDIPESDINDIYTKAISEWVEATANALRALASEETTISLFSRNNRSNDVNISPLEAALEAFVKKCGMDWDSVCKSVNLVCFEISKDGRLTFSYFPGEGEPRDSGCSGEYLGCATDRDTTHPYREVGDLDNSDLFTPVNVTPKNLGSYRVIFCSNKSINSSGGLAQALEKARKIFLAYEDDAPEDSFREEGTEMLGRIAGLEKFLATLQLDAKNLSDTVLLIPEAEWNQTMPRVLEDKESVKGFFKDHPTVLRVDLKNALLSGVVRLQTGSTFDDKEIPAALDRSALWTLSLNQKNYTVDGLAFDPESSECRVYRPVSTGSIGRLHPEEFSPSQIIVIFGKLAQDYPHFSVINAHELESFLSFPEGDFDLEIPLSAPAPHN